MPYETLLNWHMVFVRVSEWQDKSSDWFFQVEFRCCIGSFNARAIWQDSGWPCCECICLVSMTTCSTQHIHELSKSTMGQNICRYSGNRQSWKIIINIWCKANSVGCIWDCDIRKIYRPIAVGKSKRFQLKICTVVYSQVVQHVAVLTGLVQLQHCLGLRLSLLR